MLPVGMRTPDATSVRCLKHANTMTSVAICPDSIEAVWNCELCRLPVVACTPVALEGSELRMAIERVAALVVDFRSLPENKGVRLDADNPPEKVELQSRPRPNLLRALVLLSLEAARRLTKEGEGNGH